MDFSQVKKWIIPEGEVKKVVNVLDSTVLWQAIQRVLKEWRGLSPLTCTPTVAGEFEEVKVYGQSKQGVLPDGYTQLEYIESTGTQYIDTGFTWETSTKIEFTIERLGDNIGQTTGTSRANVWFGANGSTGAENMLGWGATGNANYFRGATGGSYYILPLNTKTNITFDYTKGAMKLFVNGVQDGITGSSNNVVGSKILLGGVVDISTATPILFCLERFYNSVKLWNGETLVANLIPAKRNSDNKLGMYDTVNNTFLTNAGTGEFVAGPVAPTPTAPIEIESVGDKSKNLFDKNNSLFLHGYPSSFFTWITTTGNTYELSVIIKLEEGKTYTATRKSGGNNVFRIQSSSTQTLTSGQTLKDIDSTGENNVINKTFTVPTGYPYVILYLRNTQSKSSLTDDECLEALQIEEGSTATPYEPYGYKVPVMVGGKNLFDINNVYAHGYYSETGVWISSDSFNLLKIEVEPNTKYTLTYNADAINPNGKRLHAFDENMNWISQLIGVAEPKVDLNVTITTPANTKYLTFSYNIIASALENLQLELGTQATEYQPYIQPTTTNIYLNEPLRKIAEYADTLSVDGTEVTVTRNIAEVVLDGSETIITASGMVGVSKVLSPERERQSRWYRRGLSNYGICGSASEVESIYIEIDQTQTWFGGGFNLTPDSLRTLLVQNNCISYYPVATPTTETYTIENPIMAFDNTSIITVDTTVPPSEVYTSEYVEE